MAEKLAHAFYFVPVGVAVGAPGQLHVEYRPAFGAAQPVIEVVALALAAAGELSADLHFKRCRTFAAGLALVCDLRFGHVSLVGSVRAGTSRLPRPLYADYPLAGESLRVCLSRGALQDAHPKPAVSLSATR